ncbi:MAG: Hsp20/alpha crystallin family protein [Chloroflexota bacterium]
MTTLVRWNPTRDIRSMNREMDRLMASFFGTPTVKTNNADWGLALDVIENDDAFTLSASLPGITPEDVEITINDNVLTIKGETHSETTPESEEDNKNTGTYRIRERRYGSFSRSLTLPKNVDVDHIEASQENGVLTLTLPKRAEAQPKRITIN